MDAATVTAATIRGTYWPASTSRGPPGRRRPLAANGGPAPYHDPAYFWFHLPSNSGIWGVPVNTEDWEVDGDAEVIHFNDPQQNGNWLNGIGHDGSNLWFG